MSGSNTIDSNIVGLRYTEEVFGQIGVLPGSPVWLPLEPNSYGDFGPQVKKEPRTPINSSRQRKKGPIVDLDASAGFQSDFVQLSLYNLMQGYMFADWREKASAVPTDSTVAAYTVGAVASDFAADDLVFVENYATVGNNGLKLLTATDATTLTPAGGLTAEGVAPAEALITKVGVQGAAGDIEIDTSGADPKITSTLMDFTVALTDVIPGEWIVIGGDDVGTRFDTAGNNLFARVKSISANEIELDRQPGVMATDAGVGKTIQLFIGHVIKNESDPALIKCRSYQLERSLGSAGFEYVLGATANTLEISIDTASKITVDLALVGTDGETFTSGEGAKTGTRPALPDEEAFNSSSDFSRLRLLNEDIDQTLATYLTELRLNINNGISPNKAIANLGAIGMAAGDFVVSGNTKAYFDTVEAIRAVRNDDDVSLDFALVKSNAGWVFDIPLISAGDGRLEVAKDQSIQIPLSMDGAEHPTLNHTLLVQSFTYLPDVAST